MKISSEQQAILDRLKCVRLDESYESLLSTIVCPEINGQKTGIGELFRDPQEIEANRRGTVASYLVIDDTSQPEPIVLLFFSIRTGELFRQNPYTPEQIELAFDMFQALNILANNKKSLSASEVQFLRKNIEKAKEKGIDVETAKSIANWCEKYKRDVKEEPTEDIHRVLEVFPGIELKFFGNNEGAKDLWKSFKMPRKMGETLFWKFIVPKIEVAGSVVGVEYFYLFAADQNQTPDEGLINYYQSRLHFIGDGELAANKPSFDYQCRFLFQRIEELVRMKEEFFHNFTTPAV